MKKSIQLILTFSAFLQITACTFKKANRVEHEAAKSTELNTNMGEAAQDAARVQTEQVVKSLDLPGIYETLNKVTSKSEILNLLSTLERKAINQETLNDTQLKQTDAVKTSLAYYNFGILKLIQLDSKSAEVEKVLGNYEKLAMAGCDSQLKGCYNISFLKTDQRSSKIIQTITSRLDEKMAQNCQSDCADVLKKYYNLLAVAFDTNNHLKNSDLEFLYLKRAQDYGALFQKSQNSAQVSTADQEFFRRHGAIFENIVSQYPAEAKDSKFADFVKAFKPWSYSRLNANPFPFGVEKMFSFAAQHYLYNGSGGGLNPELKTAIELSQKEADKAGPSLTMMYQDLKKDPRSSGIFKNLKIDVSSIESGAIYNEYFLMVDRLYRGHLGLDEVSSLWMGSKKDEKALLNVVNLYTKIEFIQRVVETNKYMVDIFTQKDVPNDSLFKQVVQRSEPLTREWSLMLSRMNNISIFVTQQLRNSNAQSDSFKEAQLMIDSVKRNAKFISIYPNMLLMGYFMIDLNAPLSFTAWWGSDISIDPTTVMNLLLDGSIGQPWFLFGGDSTPLDKYEMIYAFHYALNSGAFENFSTFKDSLQRPIVDRVSFFKKALKKTMQEYVDNINDSINKLHEAKESNPVYASLLNACENEFKNNKKYTVSMKLVDLQYYSIFGNSSKGILNSSYQFYNPGGLMSSLSDYRNIYESRLTQLKSMMDLLISNLSNSGLSKTEVEQTKKELLADIENLENAKKNFLVEMSSQHRAVSKCQNRLMWLEKERQTQMFKSEISYLGQVYDAMLAVRALTGEAKKAKAQELAAKLKLENPNSLLQENFYYTRLDLYQRLADYTTSMLPKIEFETPDSSTQDTLRSSLERITLVNPVNGELVNKDQFINAGMTLLNAQGSNTLMWLQETADISAWQNKLETMVELFRTNYIVNQSIDPKIKVTAQELIDESIEMAQFVHITEDEKIWLRRMNRRERIPKEKLKGFLFDTSESVAKGVMDAYYELATNVKYDLLEATGYYLSTKNVGKFLFPILPENITAIDERYKALVTRSELVIKDMDDGISTSMKKFDPKSLKITYRIEEGQDLYYSPSNIDGGTSSILDIRKQKDIQARMTDFHIRKTGSFYKSAVKSGKAGVQP